MRKMGGTWKLIPVTYNLMWVGSLALAGVIPFAGYFSKDIILTSAWAAHTSVGDYAFWLGITAPILTALYSWRMIIMPVPRAPRPAAKTTTYLSETP